LKSLAFAIGQRYSSQRNNDSLIGFISKLAKRGVVLSVVVLVVVLSIINGFERELEHKILKVVPHVTVERIGGVKDINSLTSSLLQIESVRDVLPYYQLEGLARYRNQTAPIVLYGAIVEQEVAALGLHRYLLSGRFPEDGFEVVLGDALAKKLGLTQGDRFTVVIPQDADQLPIFKQFSVSGILATGTELDHVFAMTPFEVAETLSVAGRPDGVRMQLNDVFAADLVALRASNQLGYAYHVSNWQQSYATLYYAIETSKQLIMLLLLLIVAISVFNVVTTLIMVVIEKRQDIAILRTLGMAKHRIVSAFVWQGTLIGVSAGAMGVFVGVVLSYTVPILAHIYEKLSGSPLLDSTIYPVSVVPVDVQPSDLLWLLSVTILVSALASIGPAISTLKVQPARALQHD